MPDTVRVYFDAVMALALMAMSGIIAGFIAFAITGDRTLVMLVTGGAFILTGAVLVVRLWRLTRKPPLPTDV
jgi:hypothetical protein